MFRRNMVRNLTLGLVFLAGLALALPALGSENPAKKSKALKTTFDLLQPATIDGTQLKPGTYDVTADDSTITLRLIWLLRFLTSTLPASGSSFLA